MKASHWGMRSLIYGSLFLLLALGEHYTSSVVQFLDPLVLQLLAPLQTYSFVAIFLAITTIGSIAGIIVVALGVAYFVRHKPWMLYRLALILAGSTLTTTYIKHFVARVRPTALSWFDTIPSYSFPSGHATSTMALYGFIMVVAVHRVQKKYQKVIITLVLGAVILLVGMSRIVLHAHYLSDVLGGYLNGAFWLCFVFLLPLEHWFGRYPQGLAFFARGTKKGQ